MTFKSSVRVDDRAMRRDLRRVKKTVARRATYQALNRAGSRSRTATARAVSKATGIKQSVIRGRLKLTRASRRRLRATLTALLLGVRAGDVGKARQNARGVKVARRQFDGAFVADLGSKKGAVMRRKGAARLPIRHERIEISQDAQREALKAINTVGAKEFVRECERLLARALRR